VAADRWSEAPPLRTARQGHGLVFTPDGKLCAIGGTNVHTISTAGSALSGEPDSKGSPLASVEVLDTNAKPP
jgi:hypothetical protein